MVLSRRRMILTVLMTFAFYGLMDVSAAITCPKGKRVNRSRDGCEACPPHTYQLDPNISKDCQSCTNCDESSGSEVESKCGNDGNTKCRCRPGFVHRERNFATCKCDIGSGLSWGGRGEQPKCQECVDGLFTEEKNKPCMKWKECKMSGVKVNGTKTSNVICNDELDKTDSTTHYKSHPLNRQTPSQGSPQRSTTAFVPALMLTSRDKGPFNSGKTENSSGMSPLLFGIVGVLLILILATVTCKLTVIPCIQSIIKPVVKTDSLCGRPVEESGESSSSALVKVSPGEP